MPRTTLILNSIVVGRSELRNVAAEKLCALRLYADDRVIVLSDKVKVGRNAKDPRWALPFELGSTQVGNSC
jgi:hypothetical protein